jgi:hypothetical protein
MTLCTERTLVNTTGDEGIAAPLRCKRWTCPECQPIRKRQLQQQAAAGQPTHFITLTSNPHNWADPTERARMLTYAWARIRRSAARQFGNDGIEFLAVFEKTKRGEPHLHILARCKYIPQGWLSNKLKYYTGAYIVDIRKVKDTKHAAFYVAKYIGKSPGHFGTTKRYYKSKHFVLSSPDEQAEIKAKHTGWTVEHIRFDRFVAYIEGRDLITRQTDHDVRFRVPQPRARDP